MGRSQNVGTSMGKFQKLEILWLDVKGWNIYGSISEAANSKVRSQKAETSMGKSQKLEILWLDLERLEPLWANSKSRNFYD